MRFDHSKSLFFSGIVLCVLLVTGLQLSRQKLLWNDEIYTQQTAIEVDSYAGLLTSQFPDGNKNPLFYIIQKAVCDIFSFHLPAIKPTERYGEHDARSQIIMRIPSNIYMSLALASVFYFFTRFYSVFAAVYALGVALVTPMVWEYWVDARPYALWFLLTTVQLLLLSCAFIFPKIKTTGRLLGTHILLALTTPASICQIFIVTFILLWHKAHSKKQLGLIMVLPLAIASFYYFVDAQTKIHTYMFGTNFFDVVLPERLFLGLTYALIAWVVPQKDRVSSNIFFSALYFLFVASAFLILYLDLFITIPESQSGFFSRYLMYVVPADILMYSFASIDFFRWSRHYPWICLNVSIFLIGLVMVRGLMTYRDILALATYLHSPN